MKLSSSAFKNGAIDLNFGKFANKSYLINNLPLTSFPVNWELEKSNSKFVHLIFIDYDAITAVGQPYIHWSVANLPVKEYPNGLEEGASQNLRQVINQGVNSMIGTEWISETQMITNVTQIKDKHNWENFNYFVGPMPPNSDHVYTLIAFTTSSEIPLSNPFTSDKLFRVLLNKNLVVETDIIEGMYPFSL